MMSREREGKPMTPLRQKAAFQELEQHFPQIKDVQLRELFSSDPQRGKRFCLEAEGIYFDYSKHRVTEKTCRMLIRLAEQCDLPARIDAMFRGEKINVTENRAVLHVALRAPKDAVIMVDGKNVMPEVHAVLQKMA